MIPASTLATLAGGLPPGGLPVLVVDAASLVPLLWALVGLAVAVVVARARRLRSGVKALPAGQQDFRTAA